MNKHLSVFYYGIMIVVTLCSVVVWAYSTFETKEIGTMNRSRMERLEDKTDAIIAHFGIKLTPRR